MDIDKAFERTNHTTFLNAASKAGITGTPLNWIKDFLNNRSFNVHFQGTISDAQFLKTGTPQGSVLSPTLFNLLITNILDIKFPPSTEVLAYADDLIIVSFGRNPDIQLQKTLDLVSEKTQKTGMFFSPAKTRSMTFFGSKPASFRMGKHKIESVLEYKYLGIVIDHKLLFAKHISSKLSKHD